MTIKVYDRVYWKGDPIIDFVEIYAIVQVTDAEQQSRSHVPLATQSICGSLSFTSDLPNRKIVMHHFNGKESEMTEQQYNRAVWIYERLNALKRVKKEINDSYKHRLSYTWKGSSEWRVCNDWEMKEIGEILDKHDIMIRQEINNEIEQLKAEIKAL